MMLLNSFLMFGFILISGRAQGISANHPQKKLKIYAQQATWDDALQFCNSKNMNLASALTEAEYRQLGDGIRACSAKCRSPFESSWTAGYMDHRDASNTRVFMWKGTNQQVGKFGWQPKQPDNAGGNENCLEARNFKQKDYGKVFLNDRPCGDKFHIVCETK